MVPQPIEESFLIDPLTTNNAMNHGLLTVMSNLPMKVFEVEQLFANTDVDYFGPLLVKFNKKTQTNQAILQHGSIF